MQHPHRASGYCRVILISPVYSDHVNKHANVSASWPSSEHGWNKSLKLRLVNLILRLCVCAALSLAFGYSAEVQYMISTLMLSVNYGMQSFLGLMFIPYLCFLLFFFFLFLCLFLFLASWAVMSYPEIQSLVLDASFDDLLPLALKVMPDSWSESQMLKISNSMQQLFVEVSNLSVFGLFQGRQYNTQLGNT